MQLKKGLENHITTNLNFFSQNPLIGKNFTKFANTIDYKDMEIEFALNISPYIDLSNQQTLARFGPKGIVRCTYCKGYMNPMNYFFDSNKKYICAICESMNYVPVYYNPLESGPELSSLNYIIVPEANQFAIDKKIGLYYVLVVQETRSLIKSDIYTMLVAAISNSFDEMSDDQNIILISYDQLHIYIYDLNGQEPTKYILSEGQKPFALTNSPVRQCRNNLLLVLESWTQIIENPYNLTRSHTQGRLASQHAATLLHNIGGRIFHICESEHEYKLEKEQKTFEFESTNQFFIKLANYCIKQNISYNYFLFTKFSCNAPTVSQATRLTHGQFYLYGYDAAQFEKFYYDLLHELTVSAALGCSSRLRISSQVLPKESQQVGKQEFILETHWKIRYVNFIHTVNTVVNMPMVTENTTISMELQLMTNLDKKYLVIQHGMSFQKGLKVYVSIQNLIIELHSQITSIPNFYDYENLMFYYARKLISRFISLRSAKLFKNLLLKLHSLIKHRKQPWTESLKLLILGLLKNKICITIDKLTLRKEVDNRWCTILKCMTYRSQQLLQIFIPSLMEVSFEQEQYVMPPLLPLSLDSINNHSIYVMECGEKLFFLLNNYEQEKQKINLLLKSDNNNPIFNLVDQLRSYRINHHTLIYFVNRNQQSDDYLEFMNYLLYSHGRFQFTPDYNQFITNI